MSSPRSLLARFFWTLLAAVLLVILMGVCFVKGGACSVGAAKAVSTTATVERVVDGDTVVVTMANGEEDVHVRLLGLDCPETHRNRQWIADGRNEEDLVRGRAAEDRAQELLPHGAHIRLDAPQTKVDVYGRALYYITMPDGRDYGLILIQEGYCRDYRKYPHPRSAAYQAAER